MFSYYHEEDESSFQLVDTSRPQRPLYQRNKNRFGQVIVKSFYSIVILLEIFTMIIIFMMK